MQEALRCTSGREPNAKNKSQQTVGSPLKRRRPSLHTMSNALVRPRLKKRSRSGARTVADSLPAMRWVDQTSRLLDTKFRIPGTQIRFGVDFLLGLLPGAGDGLSLAMSGVLIATMAKNGASSRLVLRMLGNVVVDAIVGTIPIAGNVFDLFFRANIRNLDLMREYYVEGKHQGRAWPMLLAIFVVLATVFAVVLVIVAAIFANVWDWLTSMSS